MGVNDFQNGHQLPVEFKLLNFTPREFKLIDAYSIIGYMSYSFAIGLTEDPLFSDLEKKLGVELVEEMRSEKINSKKAPVVSMLNPHLNAETSVIKLISNIEKGMALFEGSNGWVLNKKRMKTHQNSFFNDPHISYSNPQIWFLAHIDTPSYKMYGHFLPLVPFPVLGFNQRMTWGLTMSLTDDMDLFREKEIDRKHYLYKGQKYPYKSSFEKINIKGKESLSVEIKESIHGPIMDHVLKEKNIAWWMFGKVDLKPKHVRSDFILNGENGL